MAIDVVDSAPDSEKAAYDVKDLIDAELPQSDGFEAYMFRIGKYNAAVGEEFQLTYDNDAMGVLILSTPDMFDVSFREWFRSTLGQLGSLDAVAEQITSPIQQFLDYRLRSLNERLTQSNISYELLHDYSMWPNRRPKILMQTCGHVSGAAFYYQPKHAQDDVEDWPPKKELDKGSKFIGVSLHPLFGGHFAFRCAYLFPNLRIPSFEEPQPIPILNSPPEIRTALEKFNYSWRDSGFRDFGNPKIRYSSTQMEFFGKPPADRWNVLKEWC